MFSVECDAAAKLHTSDDLVACDIVGIHRWLPEERKSTCPVRTQVLGNCCHGMLSLYQQHYCVVLFSRAWLAYLRRRERGIHCVHIKCEMIIEITYMYMDISAQIQSTCIKR